MSWLRSSPLRQSFTRNNRSRSIDTSSTECDPKACYDSFCKHWQQIYEIILRAEVCIFNFYTFFVVVLMNKIDNFRLIGIKCNKS